MDIVFVIDYLILIAIPFKKATRIYTIRYDHINIIFAN